MMMMSRARATPFNLAHQLLLKNQSHGSQACRLLTLSVVDLNQRTIIASPKGSKYPSKMNWVKNHDLLVLGQRQFHSSLSLNTGTNSVNVKVENTGKRSIAEVVEAASKSVVEIRIKYLAEPDVFGDARILHNTGSGSIYREDGLILTNEHVVQTAARKGSKISVRLCDGRIITGGKVECTDSVSDLAIIRISQSGLPVLRLGNSDQVRAGEWVAAIGSPRSLSNSVTAGIVSNVKRMGNELGTSKDLFYIQTDAASTHGNSGGPLVNMDGEAIGLNTLALNVVGFSFAVPSDLIKKFIHIYESIQPGGDLPLNRQTMGLTLTSLTEDMVKELPRSFSNIGVKGTFVLEVSEGSPAQVCGIESADVITQINNHNMPTARLVYDLLKSAKPAQITVVRRDGEKHELILRPGQFVTNSFY